MELQQRNPIPKEESNILIQRITGSEFRIQFPVKYKTILGS
jgi:hypothetical protein